MYIRRPGGAHHPPLFCRRYLSPSASPPWRRRFFFFHYFFLLYQATRESRKKEWKCKIYIRRVFVIEYSAAWSISRGLLGSATGELSKASSSSISSSSSSSSAAGSFARAWIIYLSEFSVPLAAVMKYRLAAAFGMERQQQRVCAGCRCCSSFLHWKFRPPEHGVLAVSRTNFQPTVGSRLCHNARGLVRYGSRCQWFFLLGFIEIGSLRWSTTC